MATKLSEIDEVILRYADTLSPAAISYKLKGVISPETVASRTIQLLDAPDWLTQAQQAQMVTMKMRQLVARLEELPLTARTAEITLSGLIAIGNRLDKKIEATQQDLSTLYAFQGQVLLNAIDQALIHMKEVLTKTNQVDPDIWDNALESALRFAQIELSKAGATELEPTPIPVSGNPVPEVIAV